MTTDCRHLGRHRCLQVHYEELVANPRHWMKEVLTFLDIPWHDNVLKHHQFINSEVSLSKWAWPLTMHVCVCVCIRVCVYVYTMCVRERETHALSSLYWKLPDSLAFLSLHLLIPVEKPHNVWSSLTSSLSLWEVSLVEWTRPFIIAGLSHRPIRSSSPSTLSPWTLGRRSYQPETRGSYGRNATCSRN